MHEVLEHLDEDLAENPSLRLEMIPDENESPRYLFSVRGEGDPPRDYLFEFEVVYHSDEQTLIIRDCDYLVLDL
jgi:hypothetical protein